MIAVGGFPLQLGVEASRAPEWARPVLDAGRDAAFIDTGYLRALLNESDQWHSLARAHWDVTSAVFYTSPLVVAEAVRQFAKGRGVGQDWRWDHVTKVKTIVIDDRQIVVCSPTREVIERALLELDEMQRSLIRLDLCDALSMVILESLEHRRVLTFDDHFRAVGASVEPGS